MDACLLSSLAVRRDSGWIASYRRRGGDSPESKSNLSLVEIFARFGNYHIRAKHLLLFLLFFNLVNPSCFPKRSAQ